MSYVTRSKISEIFWNSKISNEIGNFEIKIQNWLPKKVVLKPDWWIFMFIVVKSDYPDLNFFNPTLYIFVRRIIYVANIR